MPDLALLRVLAFAAATSGSLLAQEGASPAVDPGLLQKKTAEWIETRRLIGEESATWQAEKATLSDLNAIRARESAQLDEFIQAAGGRVEELSSKKAALAKEQTDLRSWRATLESDLAALEAGLRPLLPRFPPPLREKVEEAILRIEAPESDHPLQNRSRDLLLVLQACVEFQNTITVDSEVREIGGERREVEVLYLGLTQAWYVDASGRHSGQGVPGETGWTWTENPRLASRVRSAIEIQTRRATPTFVELPFSNGESGKEASK